MALLEDALALSARARSIESDRSDNEQRSRLRSRVSEVGTAIDTIGSRLELRHEAVLAGAEITWRPSRLKNAHGTLARVSQDGLPTEKHLEVAKAAITRATTDLTKAIESGWKQWAEERVRHVPDEKIAVLSEEERHEVVADWARLRKLAGKAPRNRGEVAEFVRLLARITQALQDVRQLSKSLREILERLDSKPPLTLADLDDSSIATLRAQGFASHIQLSRRIG